MLLALEFDHATCKILRSTNKWYMIRILQDITGNFILHVENQYANVSS